MISCNYCEKKFEVQLSESDKQLCNDCLLELNCLTETTDCFCCAYCEKKIEVQLSDSRLCNDCLSELNGCGYDYDMCCAPPIQSSNLCVDCTKLMEINNNFCISCGSKADLTDNICTALRFV